MFDAKIKYDISDIERLTKMYPEASVAAREAAIKEALLLLESAVKKKTPEGAGPIHLRDTIHEKVKKTGNKVSGILGTPVEYAEPVEKGAKAHFPPIAPIQFWVQQKLRIEGEKESRSVAFLIARAISKRGTKDKAVKMFEKGFEENEAAIVRILEEIPAMIIRRVLA